MPFGSQRRSLAVTAMNFAGIEALACISAPGLLLISGYWPAMGKSIGSLIRDNALALLLPEHEVGLAEATGAAHLITYKSGTLAELRPLSQALVEPAHDVASSFQLDSRGIGARLGDDQQARYSVCQSLSLTDLELLTTGISPCHDSCGGQDTLLASF